MKKLTILFALLLLTMYAPYGCSAELSRDKAKNILDKKYSNTHVTYQLGLTGILVQKTANYDDHKVHKYLVGEDEKMALNLIQEEYVKVSHYTLKDYDGERLLWNYDTTDKLKPFILNFTNLMSAKFAILKIADIVVDKITGITSFPGDKTAKIVEYTVRIKPNPLSEIISLKRGNSGGVKINGVNEALFKKYDDGWRLVN